MQQVDGLVRQSLPPRHPRDGRGIGRHDDLDDRRRENRFGFDQSDHRFSGYDHGLSSQDRPTHPYDRHDQGHDESEGEGDRNDGYQNDHLGGYGDRDDGYHGDREDYGCFG